MKIGVVTINRPRCYLSELIASAAGHELQFFVGSQDMSFLPPGSGFSCIPDAVKGNHGTSVDSVVNHAVAYLHCTTVIEDDVQLSSQFESILNAAVAECYELRPNGHFILALASHLRWPKGGVIVPYPLDVYFGTQAMFVPKELQFDLFLFMIQSLEKMNHLGTDVVLAEYCRSHGIPLFCTVNAIAKHIGEQSSFSDARITVEYPSYIE